MDAKELLKAILDHERKPLVGLGYGTRNELIDQFLEALRAPPEVKFRWNRELWPEGAPAPAYKTAGAIGADLVAAEDADILPGELKLVRTGLHIELPPGWECQVRPRSGLALKNKLTLNNSPGTIDFDYRGDVSAMLISHQPQLGFRSPEKIRRGDRVAQLVICRAYQAKFVEVDELSDTTRGEAGFGSTGVK